MSLTDTAEYWQDVKRKYPYTGKDFYHIPECECGHRYLFEAKRIDDVNCYSCLKLIKNGYEHRLPEGKTDFRSKGQKKRDNKAAKLKGNNEAHQKKLVEKYGLCECGYAKVQRTNRNSGTHFLGCSNFPKCKKTFDYKKE